MKSFIYFPQKAFLLFLIILNIPQVTFSQLCDNAGLESGQLGNYQPYLGDISSNGKVDIKIEGADPSRHRIMHISEGFDPIAAKRCDINNMLPVVPPGGGQYALRLGNAKGGAKAERVVLNFTVTPDLTFFLLRYAVVLQDPNHDPDEQPRFELRIRDEAGEIFQCGEYSVRAAPNIPGFENCGSWRIRPWTIAGFELQSFIGQNIEIEILTTDCAQSGHAGYAYIDANCKPLEIDLEGYCPGKNSVTMQVTEGFTHYLWSTGDTTNIINIDNPIPGTEYAVTVTSATGCTLELQQLVPEIEELPQPIFDALPDVQTCLGQVVDVQPTGLNLEEIFSPELGFSASQFQVSPKANTTYTFISSDRYKCKFDTVSFTAVVDAPPVLAIVDSVSCFGGNDGSINLTVDENIPNSAIQWEDGSIGKSIANLPAGIHQITLTDGNCSHVYKFEVAEPTSFITEQFDIKTVSCANSNDGSIEIEPRGGTAPYTYSWSNIPSSVAKISGLNGGIYQVTVTDAAGCQIEEEFEVEEPPPIIITHTQRDISCYGLQDGQSTASVQGGVPPYTYRWDDPLQQSNSSINGLSSDTYIVTVRDAVNCIETSEVTIHMPPPLESKMSQDSVKCFAGNDGSAIVEIKGGTPNYKYIWNDSLQQTAALAQNLPIGDYSVTITDTNGCELIDQITVLQPTVLQVNLTQDSVSCNGGNDGQAIATVSGGSPNYIYHWLSPTSQNRPIARNLMAGLHTIQITDANACLIEKAIYVLEPLPIDITPITYFFPNCDNQFPGTTIVEARGGNGGFSFEWENGGHSDTLFSFKPGPHIVTVFDRKDCQGHGEAKIKLFETDISANTSGIETEENTISICLSDSIKLGVNANNSIRQLRWMSNFEIACDTCREISIRPIESTRVRLEALDQFGCLAKEDIEVFVDKTCYPFIPNAFSPNGDDINDYFFVPESDKIESVEKFQIFDRWGGQALFSGCENSCPPGDLEAKWDGTRNNQLLNPDVYVYLIELKLFGIEKPVLFRGDVLLIR